MWLGGWRRRFSRVKGVDVGSALVFCGGFNLLVGLYPSAILTDWLTTTTTVRAFLGKLNVIKTFNKFPASVEMEGFVSFSQRFALDRTPSCLHVRVHTHALLFTEGPLSLMMPGCFRVFLSSGFTNYDFRVP